VAVVDSLLILNRQRWYLRWPVKCLVMALAYVIVCFPYPGRLIKHVQRWRNPDVLIEPDAVELEPLMAELQPLIGDDMQPSVALRTVEQLHPDIAGSAGRRA